MKLRKGFLKADSLILSMLFVLSVFAFNGSSAFAEEANQTTETLQSQDEYSYADYQKEHSAQKAAESEIVLDPLQYQNAEHVKSEETDGKLALTTEENSTVTYEFESPEDGLYHLILEYYPLLGKNTKIERKLYIDGKILFDELGRIELNRIYKDQEPAIEKDTNGNEYFNGLIEAAQWISYAIEDSYGYYKDPFQFYLAKGKHTLTIESVKEPVAIGGITFKNLPSARSYAEVLNEWKKNGATDATENLPILEAEKSDRKSDSILTPTYDRNSSKTTPISCETIKMNIISSDKWQQAGQWLEWEIDVKQSGLYKMAFRVRQNTNDGMLCTRKLLIDGNVPFAEAENITVGYDTKWQIVTLGKDQEPYYIYLEKGRHTLRLQNTLGETAEVLVKVNGILQQLNQCYREIMMITGASPDTYRDYKLDKLIPDTIENLGKQSKALEEAMNDMRAKTGIKGSYLAPLDRLMIETKEMSEDHTRIPKLFDSFENNIGSLAAWITSSQAQPLDIDKIYLVAPDYDLPKAEDNFFVQLWHDVKVFISSFFNNVDKFDAANEKKNIKVWIGSSAAAGRDQAQLIKRMIDSKFTPQTGISVNFELVAGGSLLPASLSGNGPDVAMWVGATETMNYAFRGAVEDISKYDGFDEMKSQFLDSAILPLSYDGKTYGLPEAQQFSVMFYRKDILNELKLSVPETWDDVYNMLSTLQRNNMNFALPVSSFSTSEALSISSNITPGVKSFAMLLYQNGGSLYRDGGRSSALDEKVAIDTFKQWTDFYKNYKLPLSYDFANRFAMGEIPLGIADYGMYNNLMISFPEIKGLWDFTSVPGVKKQDGTVDHSTTCDVQCCIMMSKAKDKESTWEFMKFWTSSEQQIEFGRDIEALLGPSGRWPSANIEAVKQIPWKTNDLNNLMAQWKWVKGIPEVPGGYYTIRYLDFSFRSVAYNKQNQKDVLLDNVRIINNELSTKREEFGYD